MTVRAQMIADHWEATNEKAFRRLKAAGCLEKAAEEAAERAANVLAEAKQSGMSVIAAVKLSRKEWEKPPSV
jgi:hypothetical protein